MTRASKQEKLLIKSLKDGKNWLQIDSVCGGVRFDDVGALFRTTGWGQQYVANRTPKRGERDFDVGAGRRGLGIVDFVVLRSTARQHSKHHHRRRCGNDLGGFVHDLHSVANHGTDSRFFAMGPRGRSR